MNNNDRINNEQESTYFSIIYTINFIIVYYL